MKMYANLKWLNLVIVLVMLAGCAPAAPTPAPTAAVESSAATTAPATAVQQPAATKAPQPTPTTAPVEREPVVLNFVRAGFGDDALKEFNAQMAPFFEEYPWIKIEVLVVPPADLGPKLQTAIAGGAPPDLAMMFPGDALRFEKSGVLLDLTPFAEAEGFDWKAYYDPASIDFFASDGRLYCMQESVDTQVLAYNKGMFDAAGLPYPDETWTWDTLVDVAKQLTKDLDGDGKVDQWGFATHTWNYQPFIWMAGGSLFNQDFSEINITDPTTTETLQWLSDLINVHGVWPPAEVREAFPEVSFMFVQNKLAMYTARWIPDTAFFFPRIEGFAWDVTLLPKHPETGMRVSGRGGGCTAVFAGTKHPEEAYLVWRWMQSDEGVYYRSVGNTGTPMLPGGPAEAWPMLTNAFLELQVPEHAELYLDSIAFTRMTELPLENAREIFATMDPYLDELWLGLKTAADIAPLIEQEVGPLLGK